EGDSRSDEPAADAVAALVGSHGHFGQLVLAGTHRDECAAADADSIAHGHEDAATGVKNCTLRLPQHVEIRGLQPEVALDPLAIEFEEGICIGRLKLSDDDIGHWLGPPACVCGF